jgi:hypothetical protein
MITISSHEVVLRQISASGRGEDVRAANLSYLLDLGVGRLSETHLD